MTPEEAPKPPVFFPKGFIADYLAYAKPLTDAPPEFHLIVGIVVLAASFGQKVYLPMADRRIYPNIWALVIAPSSAYRKSTALGIGAKILKKYDPRLLLANDFSQEAFLEGLVEQPHGLLVFSEFASLLELLQRSYMLGTKSLLTDLYDCPPEKQRKLKSKTFTIKNPCISLLGASTLDWLLSNLREGDIQGGFLARFLFVIPTNKSKALPIPPLADFARGEKLVEELNNLQTLSGEMTLSEESRVHYESWYHGHMEGLAHLVHRELLGGFFNRLPDYCFKFAMLYAISVEKNMTISGEAMRGAIALSDYFCRNVTNLVETELQFTEEGKNKRKLFETIHRYFEQHKRAIDHSVLLRNSHITAKKLKEAAGVLIEEKKIVLENGQYWPTAPYNKFANGGEPVSADLSTG